MSEVEPGLAQCAAQAQLVCDSRGLPENPLAAAATFHARIVARLRDQILVAGQSGAALVLLFDGADHTHAKWRRVAVQALAREWAPLRINAIAARSGEDPSLQAAIAQTMAFLAEAPGITGQVLEVGGICAELD